MASNSLLVNTQKANMVLASGGSVTFDGFILNIYYPPDDCDSLLKELLAQKKNNCLTRMIPDRIFHKFCMRILDTFYSDHFASYPSLVTCITTFTQVFTPLLTNARSISYSIIKKEVDYKLAATVFAITSRPTSTDIISVSKSLASMYDAAADLFFPLAISVLFGKKNNEELLLRTHEKYSRNILDILGHVGNVFPNILPDAREWNQIRNSIVHNSTTYSKDSVIFRDIDKDDLVLSYSCLIKYCMKAAYAFRFIMTATYCMYLPWAIAMFINDYPDSTGMKDIVDKFNNDINNATTFNSPLSLQSKTE